MTKTTNYQLPKWEKTDRVQMKDFNDMTATLDAALKANADAIAETAAAFPLVKIKEVTLGSSTAAYTLDVSDVDFTQYHRIELYCSAAYSDLRVTVRVNGQSSGYHSGAISGGGTGSTATALGYLGGGTMLFYEPKAGDDVGTISFYGTNAGSFSGYNTMKAYIYCRVAHDDGFSLELQADELRRYAKQAGYTVVGIAAEYGSGVTLDRPALQEVTEAVLAGRVDVVLVNSLDRLGRDRSMTKQYIDLLTEHKVKLHCVRERMIIDSDDFLPLEEFCAMPSERCKEQGMCCQVR